MDADWKASDVRHVRHLADTIREAPSSWHPTLLSAAYAHDLMRMRGLIGLAMRLVRVRGGRAGLLRFFERMQRKAPSQVEAWVTDMADHVESGRDREDRDSAGGWSQRELDLFVATVLGSPER